MHGVIHRVFRPNGSYHLEKFLGVSAAATALQCGGVRECHNVIQGGNWCGSEAKKAQLTMMWCKQLRRATESLNCVYDINQKNLTFHTDFMVEFFRLLPGATPKRSTKVLQNLARIWYVCS